MKFIFLLFLGFSICTPFLSSGVSYAKDVIATQTKDTIVFGANNDVDSYVGKLAVLVYTEAFKRLKIPFKVKIFPLKRLDLSTRSGLVDGDIARTALWGSDREDLIRIEEPIMHLNFIVYTADPDLVIHNPSDISKKNLTINYPRAMRVCEKFAKKLLPLKQVEDVTTSEDGLRKVLIHKDHLHCDLRENVESYLKTSGSELNGRERIKKVYVLESKVPIYPYLIKKHAELAFKLNQVLKQMRSEGLLDKFQRQVEKEFKL